MKPTIEQLNESWDSFLKHGIYIDQRFLMFTLKEIYQGKIYV